MKTYVEEKRTLPISAETDVLVVGGGPAGIGAALGAARAGAKTMLIEKNNAPGGMATCGMMSHWCGSTLSPLAEEITDHMDELDYGSPLPGDRNGIGTKEARWIINHECLKSVLFEMLAESGVRVQLHTMAAGVIMEEQRIRGIITESKSGREAVTGKVVIDATGDGDVAAMSGAEYTLGREGDNLCQPATLMFRIGGVNYSNAIFPGSFESRMNVPHGEVQSLAEAILPHPSGHVLLYRSRLPGEVCVNMTNVTGVDGTDVRDLTRAETVCRTQMNAIVRFLREYVPGYEKSYLTASAHNVGIRETRHFKGVYTMTAEDIVEARVFKDWIATNNCFNFDIHSVKGPGLDENGAQHLFRSAGKYTIPYRSCIPEKIDSLLLSGRNISGTHKAHSNFRAMPICINTGHGVGVAAALACRDNILPRDVDIKEAQNILIKQGVTPQR